jgi:hypothetical protein
MQTIAHREIYPAFTGPNFKTMMAAKQEQKDSFDRISFTFVKVRLQLTRVRTTKDTGSGRDDVGYAHPQTPWLTRRCSRRPLRQFRCHGAFASLRAKFCRKSPSRASLIRATAATGGRKIRHGRAA